MDPLSFFFGVLGNIGSGMIFLAPVSTFRRVVKNQSTEEFESLPYVTALLSASLWTYYGIIKPEGILVATINGSGALLESIYVVLFLVFAPPKMKVKTALMVGLDVVIIVSAILITKANFKGEARVDTIGLLCAGLNIITYGSPLSAMTRVVKTKSVEYMPFFLSFSICTGGAAWTIYAILVRDYYVGVSNGTGSVLGATQLILYFIYRNASPSKSSKVDVSEEQWKPHEPLIEPADHQADKTDLV